MIKKINQSSLDKKYLSILNYKAVPISADFRNLFVNKPWGSEYLMYDNDDVEVWHLFIKHQRSTSMHCHPNKRTALVVIEGRALFSSLNESMELLPLDAVILDPGVFHSSQSISSEGLRLLEFENPPMKHDLLRLEDRYGRTEQGYEGIEKMTKDKEHTRFYGVNKGSIQNFCNKKICLKTVQSRKDIENLNGMDLAIILGGRIESRTKENLFLVPGITTVDELLEIDCTFNNADVLFIGR